MQTRGDNRVMMGGGLIEFWTPRVRRECSGARGDSISGSFSPPWPRSHPPLRRRLRPSRPLTMPSGLVSPRKSPTGPFLRPRTLEPPQGAWGGGQAEQLAGCLSIILAHGPPSTLLPYFYLYFFPSTHYFIIFNF